MDGLEGILETLLFTEFGRKHAEGWMFLIAALISFGGWMSPREISSRIRRTKDEALQHLSADKLMYASYHTTNSGETTNATIQNAGSGFVLTLSVINPLTDTAEKKQHFDSLDAVAAHLEKNTLLRLGDFR